MKQKDPRDPRIDLALSIAWAILGALFLYQGLKIAGVSRAIFLIFGVIDLLYSLKLMRSYLCSRDKK